MKVLFFLVTLFSSINAQANCEFFKNDSPLGTVEQEGDTYRVYLDNSYTASIYSGGDIYQDGNRVAHVATSGFIFPNSEDDAEMGYAGSNGLIKNTVKLVEMNSDVTNTRFNFRAIGSSDRYDAIGPECALSSIQTYVYLKIMNIDLTREFTAPAPHSAKR